MISRRQKAAALAVLLAAYRRYGQKRFKVDVCGENYRPLRDCETLGWVWFTDGTHCAILDAGVREVEPYRREDPRPVVQWVCPTCQSVVGQEADAEGLPARPSCPHCRRETERLAERMRPRSESAA